MPRKGLLIVFKETRGLKRVHGAMEDLILDKDPREHRKYIWGGGLKITFSASILMVNEKARLD